MADTPKHLGSTTSTTAVNLYDNGATGYTVIHSIIICNTSANTAYTYNISKSTTSGTHELYLVSAATVNPNDSIVMQMAQVLDSSCRYLVVNASNAAVRITASGVIGP